MTLRGHLLLQKKPVSHLCLSYVLELPSGTLRPGHWAGNGETLSCYRQVASYPTIAAETLTVG